MNLADSLRALSAAALDPDNRPARLGFGGAQRALERQLVLQHADIREGFMTGIAGQLTCLSPRADLPAKSLIGLPVSVQITTDQGRLHAINAIVTSVRAGQSDGALSCYSLTIRDALSLMEQGKNRRIFRQKSLPDILQVLLGELRQRSAAMARAFDFDLSGLNRNRYPPREFVQQANESTAHFIRRLLRRDGVTVFVKAGTSGQQGSGQDGSTPVHTLVFCDDPMRLSQGPASTVRYHQRDAGTEERDTITLFAITHSLTTGVINRQSWDYKPARMLETQMTTTVDHGESGNDLARILADYVIDVPHAGDSTADLDRIGHDRMLAHEAQAERVDGVSGVRDLAVGTWFQLVNHPEVDQLPAEQRQFVVTSLHHDVWNNLPADLNDRASALLDVSRAIFQQPASPASSKGEKTGNAADRRYTNTFSCVRRGVPLTPAFDPNIDLPRVHPITALVVAPENEEVFIDELGRVYVQIPGLNPADHEHAQGAGTNGTPADSAPVRVACAMAGATFGVNIPLRAGMEVILDHLNGDPDRLVITGVLSNGQNRPAAFNHVSALPKHSYVSGMKTKEFQGQRYNQLRFIDAPQRISSQLGSEHALSELNLGQLTHLQSDGLGNARGEGAELRTEAAAAVRAAMGILLTTYTQNQPGGHHLEHAGIERLTGACLELFKAMSDYTGQHGGQAADTKGQTDVTTSLKNWETGATTGSGNASSGSSASAIVAIGAEAGMVTTTPKTHVTYAGENIDQVSQQHLQLLAGQRLNAMAGQGVHVFARGQGFQAIAGEGPVTLQAQSDVLTANAQKGVQISTNAGDVKVTGPTISLIAEDGSYVKVGGGGITFGTNGAIKLLSASHQWGGPSTEQAAKTPFNNLPTDQRFRVHYPGDTPETAAAAANKPYRITMDDGSVKEGVTDANGLTDVVKDDAMRILKIDLLKPSL
ncbi:type VI secretion system Vgr family protein [Paraburkholderia flava]|uniref:type VI secretion system Vgr family protein n=1 Tax=Paraburkholderia flava TaxID=2547393 RepID=UPI00105B750E|nr:type VI secretion system Vgr family protein [Paraburkholderia flava]